MQTLKQADHRGLRLSLSKTPSSLMLHRLRCLAEVLEFGYRPPVVADKEDGEHRYILAGCTCLAGDVFGEYAFDEPLAVGSRVIFPEQGAYSAVKWHWFNGVNLPTIHALTEDGQLVEKKRFTYDDFAAQCGARTHAAT